jgi:hypothetical protein
MMTELKLIAAKIIQKLSIQESHEKAFSSLIETEIQKIESEIDFRGLKNFNY